MALTFQESDLTALKEALLTGALEVQIGDRKITYRSQADLIRAIQMVQNAISPPTSTTSPDLVKATYTKGHD
jgi:hypothetical protein